MPTKKKKKKGRYKRGIHESPVAGLCKFRSGWEKSYMCYLDSHPEVQTWTYEKMIIEYVSNKSTGRTRKYYPDFYVEYKSGEKVIVEIKQKRKLAQLSTRKKIMAAEQWCRFNSVTFKIITEIELKELGLI